MKNLVQQKPDLTDSQGDFWFPGPWVGGVSLVIAPLILLAGILIRLPYHYFFPQQLAAYHEHPALMTTSYNLFAVGNILLWPAVIALAHEIGKTRKQLAVYGGTLVILGLFARVFHSGVDYFTFRLVNVQGLEAATKTVADSYGAFNLLATLNAAIFFGWIVLAVGAYFSGTLNLIRSVSLALMSALMLGVLKGSSWMSVLAVAGLCIAFVPQGIKLLQQAVRQASQKTAWHILAVCVLIIVFYFLGQAG